MIEVYLITYLNLNTGLREYYLNRTSFTTREAAEREIVLLKKRDKKLGKMYVKRSRNYYKIKTKKVNPINKNMSKSNAAEEALTQLKRGIDSNNKRFILNAYNIVESEDFSWDDQPDYLYYEWESFVDQANEILES